MGPASAQVLQLLGRVPLVVALPEAQREQLAATVEDRHCGDGETIFNRGDEGRSLYVVASGEVDIYLPAEPPGPETILKRLVPGDYFGELAVLDGGVRTASARAIGAVRLIGLSQDSFFSTVFGSPEASLLLMRELTARLRNTTTLLAQRASRDVVRELDEQLTPGERFANQVARWNGSWLFILVIAAGSFGWMGLNSLRPLAFDPYPYAFFNLVLAILVVLQGPLIMMAQNRENRQERARAEVDYRVNLKNEIAIERIGLELERIAREQTLLKSWLAERLGHGAPTSASGKSASAPS